MPGEEGTQKSAAFGGVASVYERVAGEGVAGTGGRSFLKS